MLAELLIRTVQATAVGLDLQPLSPTELDEGAEPLLPPLQPGNYETNSSSCWLGVREGMGRVQQAALNIERGRWQRWSTLFRHCSLDSRSLCLTGRLPHAGGQGRRLRLDQ
jgi:hypothetical protein